jgi:hypothetical protein
MLEREILMNRFRWFVLDLMELASFSVLHCRRSTGDENNSNLNGQTHNTIRNNDFAGAGNDSINLNGSSSVDYVSDNCFHDQSRYKAPFCRTGTPTGHWSDKQRQTVAQNTAGASGLIYTLSTGSCEGIDG